MLSTAQTHESSSAGRWIRRGLATAMVVSLALLAASPGHADTITDLPKWEGTISYTFTELYTCTSQAVCVEEIAGLSVGDTFYGQYSYYSETGDFSPGGDPANGSFSVYFPDPLLPGGEYRGGSLAIASEQMGFGLYVEDGRIVDVSRWSYSSITDSSFWYGETFRTPNGHLGFFGIKRSGGDTDLAAFGTASISDPHRVPEPSTLLLLSVGLAGLFLGPRKRNQRPPAVE